MKMRLHRALGALFLLVPALTCAQHDYSYIEGGFVNIDYDRGDDSGLRLGGSLDLGAPLALIGEYTDTGDFRQLSAGLLFYSPLDEGLDLTGGATLEHWDVGGRRGDDDLGIGLRGGLRWLALTEAHNPGRLEIGGELRHVFIFDDSATSVRGSALYRIVDDLDLQGAIQVGDDDRFELGVRYHFTPARAPQRGV